MKSLFFGPTEKAFEIKYKLTENFMRLEYQEMDKKILHVWKISGLTDMQ